MAESKRTLNRKTLPLHVRAVHECDRRTHAGRAADGIVYHVNCEIEREGALLDYEAAERILDRECSKRQQRRYCIRLAICTVQK